MTPNRSSKRRLLSAGLQFALAATLGSAAPFAVAAEAYPAQTIKVSRWAPLRPARQTS